MPSERNPGVSPLNGLPPPPPAVRGKGVPITKENASELGKKGGAAIREKYKLKEALLRELCLKVRDENGKRITNYEVIVRAAIKMATKNPKFWELIRDTIGEKPNDKVDITHGFVADAVIRVGYDPVPEELPAELVEDDGI